jgi:hypothetical protein
VDRSAYERALAAFHAALARHPSPGFNRSRSYRIEGAPWLEGGAGYEDWYEVEGTASLDPLDAAVVGPELRPWHDAVARLSATGTAGLYRRISEPATGSRGPAWWLRKPAGTSYPEFLDRLRASVPPGTGLWQRQMVLGPTPEFCIEAPATEPGAPSSPAVLAGPPLEWGALVLQRTPVIPEAGS